MRVVRLEDIEAAREAQYGRETLLWRRMRQVGAMMQAPDKKPARARVSRPKALSQYGPGKHHVAQVYAETTGQEKW